MKRNTIIGIIIAVAIFTWATILIFLFINHTQHKQGKPATNKIKYPIVAKSSTIVDTSLPSMYNALIQYKKKTSSFPTSLTELALPSSMSAQIKNFNYKTINSGKDFQLCETQTQVNNDCISSLMQIRK